MILDSIHQTRALLHEGGAITAQIAQFTLLAAEFCAIHSPSCRSVLRPGTALMCWAFTNNIFTRPSRTFRIGFQ